jgi:hypothetical protein
MTSRRQFIHAGLAVSAASLAIPQALQARPATAGASALPVELFIYDDRFVEAIEAARVATASDLRVASTRHVLQALWYDELDLSWKRAPMTLTGMTTPHGLFVLETLAQDRGMRVLQREASATTELVTWTIGPRADARSIRTN